MSCWRLGRCCGCQLVPLMLLRLRPVAPARNGGRSPNRSSAPARLAPSSSGVQLAPPRTTTTQVVPGVRGNAAADVTLGKCTTKYGIGEWPITIQNRSSKRSDYAIKANFMGPTGIRLGEGLAFVSNVEPGQIASEKITGFLSDDIRTITCVLTEVTRTASL